MIRLLLMGLLLCSLFVSIIFVRTSDKPQPYGAPPYSDDVFLPSLETDRYGDLSTWKRPDGPLRVSLQAGHWKNRELPDELSRIRESGGGTSNGSIAEWEVNLRIAEETKILLEREGVQVDILPATIPPGYYADAVIAIHADGSTNPAKSGFKVATPRRDMSGKAKQLADIIEQKYQQETGLAIDPNITRNMTGYYAFAWRRFEHATHPMAPAVILETGFLTNASDATMLIQSPHIPARAITQAVLQFLKEENS